MSEWLAGARILIYLKFFPHMAQITALIKVYPNGLIYALRTVYDDGSSLEWHEIYKNIYKITFRAEVTATVE